MEDLPELPFEQILSHLNLEDRLKLRCVSRGWRKRSDFKVKTLYYSEHRDGFIYERSQLVTGAFVQNVINSFQFEPFVNTFGQMILSDLKHLRLGELHFITKKRGTSLASTLNLFGQLEQLGLIGLTFYWDSKLKTFQ